MFTWAMAFPIADILLRTWGTVALASTRMALGVTVLFLLWIMFEGVAALKHSQWRSALLIGGVGFGIGTLLFLFGQKLTYAVTPAIAAAMMPICGAIIEVFLDKRVLHRRTIIGIVLALLGGLLATGASVGETRIGLGFGLCVTAVFLFAWATRATTQQLSTLTTLGRTTSTMIGAFIVIVITHLTMHLFDAPTAQVGTMDSFHLTILVVSAIFSLALAHLMWIWGAGTLGILIASFHMNAVPFYVMVILVLFMNQHWQWSQALGGLLVAVGVVLAQSRKSSTRIPH